MNKQAPIARRDLLKYSAGGLAAVTALSGCARAVRDAAPLAVADRKKPKPPSEKIVVGLIGVGDLGRRYHLDHYCLERLKDQLDVAAVCDVDSNHVHQAARLCMEKAGRRVGVYKDYRHLIDRKDIDAVIIVTPDHWHALPSIAAMEAGMDVYCEKPLTLTIDEGKAMVAAARRYGTVFQTGSQQRSDGRFRQACELVRSGKIGKVKQINTVLHSVGAGRWEPATTPPPELDWDFWLGPAPYVDYHPNLVHYQFRWLYDYSGGVLTDWGAHHNDIAQWGLGTDDSGPVYVDASNATFHEQGPHNVIGDFDIHYKYADGTDLFCHTKAQSYDDGTTFGNGIRFTGTDGWVFVTRGAIHASDPEILEAEPADGDVRLYQSEDHHQNWLDCIRTREKCICDVSIGHRSATICHLGNISALLRRPLQWDPQKEEFVGDAEADRMRCRPMRAPWYM